MVRVSLLALLLVTTACSGGAQPKKTKGYLDNQVAVELPEKSWNLVMQEANATLAKYTATLLKPNTINLQNEAQGYSDYLQELAIKHRRQWFETARDQSKPVNQGIAVAVLGFSESPDALAVLTQAVVSSDTTVRNNATFAMAILKDPDTNVGLLWGLIRDEDQLNGTRACAAWALHEIQGRVFDKEPILAIWRKILDGPIDAYPDMVLVNAIRGIGKSDQQELADLIVPYLAHPRPAIRENSCNSLGLLRRQDTWRPMVEILEGNETNQNVRLAARKALSGLAGGVDHQYDAKLWRRVFDRGTGGP